MGFESPVQAPPAHSFQFPTTRPQPPGGSRSGTIATVFNRLLGGGTAVIGRMFFVTTSGCLTQVQSVFPFGTHVIDDAVRDWPVGPDRRGSVCVGSNGMDACVDPAGAVATERTTWGAIKAHYR